MAPRHALLTRKAQGGAKPRVPHGEEEFTRQRASPSLPKHSISRAFGIAGSDINFTSSGDARLCGVASAVLEGSNQVLKIVAQRARLHHRGRKCAQVHASVSSSGCALSTEHRKRCCAAEVQGMTTKMKCHERGRRAQSGAGRAAGCGRHFWSKLVFAKVRACVGQHENTCHSGARQYQSWRVEWDQWGKS